MEQATAVNHHLWSVNLENSSGHLWITTSKRDILLATRKALKVTRTKSSEFYLNRILSVNYNGTIDA